MNKTVDEHHGNIFKSEELGLNSVIRNFRITATDTKLYNLDQFLFGEDQHKLAERTAELPARVVDVADLYIRVPTKVAVEVTFVAPGDRTHGDLDSDFGRDRIEFPSDRSCIPL